ncbi:hypothetical protein PRZ48_000421 [Zasmidium cellare]|uniref:C2H2-type domain-containing protein n=1 Tax=Zasmidium cellare TaxID=395010 RepID=A0ABR0EZP7_ZASCE|nr:hypothetical protein PRZ48_000421 [Zasmidium cellare]
MDGRNCTGRKISLLNDSSDVAVPTKLPPLHSRTSSCTSTPSLSPQTPILSRSSSSDSRAFASPSPLTPSFNSFEQAAQAKHHHHQQYYLSHQHHYAKMDDQSASMYPPIPDATGVMPSAYPIPQLPPQPVQQQPQAAQQLYHPSASPSSEPSRVSTVSAQSNNKAAPKKNQYPCPMAKQVGCTDFFTTSGHAARHAKKHTGKKDAFCPECNKAFTRKDNMEQHRRTHQNGRGASRSSNDDSKVKKPTKPTKKSAPKAEPQLEAAVEQQLADQATQAQTVAPLLPVQGLPQQTAEQALLLPSAGPYFLNGGIDPGPVPSLPMAMPDLAGRPPLHRSSFANSLEFVPPSAPMIDPDTLHYSYPSPGLSNGLNSLALAASEHRRMSEKSSSQSPSTETPSQGTP